MSIEKAIQLKPGREKSVINRHPWIFSGAVMKVFGEPKCGDLVYIKTSTGQPLGVAAYSPDSNIRARMWSWDPEACIDRKYFKNAIKEAVSIRSMYIEETETNAIRLIHGESDGLPGLVVDRYADTLIVQLLSCGAEYWKEVIVEELILVTEIENVYERSDATVRHIEGLPLRKGVIKGDPPTKDLVIYENGLKFLIDPIDGQKTGFFIDQRHNRLLLRKFSKDRKVLDCFCYTGGFTVNAIAGNAKQIVAIDSSQEALEMCRKNVQLNGLDEERVEWKDADVFESMRKLRDRNQKFDLLILDPPKFAPNYKQVQKASRAYKDINLLAFKLLNPGGILFTFSCSGGVNEDLFQKIVYGAALDANVNARIINKLNQGLDHPIALNFPEGNYLKGLICSVN